MISVVIADTQPLFREALARAIRQDAELQLVAEAEDGRGALSAIHRHGPRLAVLAAELGDLDGEHVLAAVARDRLPTRVVLLDAQPSARAWTFVRDGAAGVLSRSVTPDGLRAAVHSVARGGTVLCEEAQAAVAKEVRARHVTLRPLLSPREQEVLYLVADGLSAPEIARRLQLATSTVRTHHKHLLVKLDAHDRAQLVRHAMRHKLLD